MTKVCWYFQVHQPMRLRNYKIFDIGHNQDYFNDSLNRDIFRKVSYNCYLPMNQLLLKLLKQHKELKISFSISGIAIEQMEKYFPEVLDSFKELVQTGKVELLCETYYHSLSSLYSKDEFYEQISQHKKIIKHHFGIEPEVFRNTELIYSNDIAQMISELGFKAMLLEGWGPALNFKSPNYIYSNSTNSLKLLAKNYSLSDDIAFRFSNTSWEEWPLTPDKYTNWISKSLEYGDVVNLFMDYETFGEHHLTSTGIFEFMEHLPQLLLNQENISFTTPSSIINEIENKQIEIKDIINVKEPISWADTNRDLKSWTGNIMQEEALKDVFELEKDVKKYGTLKELQEWKKLTTSDHFYYMGTHLFEDEKIIHSYFSCYESPYEAYIFFKNVLKDLKQIIRVRKQQQELLRNQDITKLQNEV
ncbi:MAG: glycoside hydrolase family 57 protein [Nanoarchaeota archaeon]|nr:glycoside hydrolase family 57 protein [Nanoarchaeota archaeon]